MAFGYLSDFIKYAFGVNIPLPIPMFGLWVALAFLIGTYVFKLDVLSKMKRGYLPGDINAADLSSNLALIAGISGIVGARIFHILEYTGQFTADPWGMIAARGGYSILGGVAFGVFFCGRYVLKKGLNLRAMLDCGGPAITIGYAIGRIGCQMSGDGDWGIVSNLSLKPSWVPTWLWAYPYKGNVIGAHIPPPGVYPTPLYESMAAFLIFWILWRSRGYRHQAGWVFGLYMLLNSIERFLIELIRVNSKYDLGFVKATQAEILSVFMFIAGLFLVIKWWKPRDIDLVPIYSQANKSKSPKKRRKKK